MIRGNENMITVVPVLTDSPQTLQMLPLKRGKLIFWGYLFISGKGLAIMTMIRALRRMNIPPTMLSLMKLT